jgi:hypothetical protein
MELFYDTSPINGLPSYKLKTVIRLERLIKSLYEIAESTKPIKQKDIHQEDTSENTYFLRGSPSPFLSK